MGWLEKAKGRRKKKARRTKPAGAPMILTATTTEIRRNVGRVVHPGTYKIKDVICEDSGRVVWVDHYGRHRAKVQS